VKTADRTSNANYVTDILHRLQPTLKTVLFEVW